MFATDLWWRDSEHGQRSPFLPTIYSFGMDVLSNFSFLKRVRACLLDDQIGLMVNFFFTNLCV